MSLARLFSRPPVTRQGDPQSDVYRVQGPQPISLDIDANDNEASAAAQSQRLFGPDPGRDRPILPYEVPWNLPDVPPPAPQSAFLRALADIFRSPAYETYGPFPCGGPTGNYSLVSPLSTAAEWQLVAVTFTAAGTAFVSDTPNVAIPGATTLLNAATNGGAFSQLKGFPLAAPGAVTQVLGINWTPIDANGSVFVGTNLSSGAAWAIITFRRLLTADALPEQNIYGAPSSFTGRP